MSCMSRSPSLDGYRAGLLATSRLNMANAVVVLNRIHPTDPICWSVMYL
jgi:hypothetical protein